MVSAEFEKQTDIFISKTEAKKYRKENAEMLGLLAVSDVSMKRFGSSIEALKFLIQLVEQYEEQQVMDMFATELGLGTNKT